MPNVLKLLSLVRHGDYNMTLEKLYGSDTAEIKAQKVRYSACLQAFSDLYGRQTDVHIFSTPGRTELSGNHTDHNNGIAIAAAVTADIIAVAGKNNDNVLRVRSRGYDKTIITELNCLDIQEKEIGRSPALVRGIAAAVQKFGGKIGGVDIYTSSNIIKGSGLSSSAAFEVVLASILNYYYNDNCFTAIDLAKMGRYAENIYYKKQCGLLDQIACSTGGIVFVDLKAAEQLKIEKIKYDFDAENFDMCVVDTRLSHGNQQKEYDEIFANMQKVAQIFGKQLLGEVSEKEFYSKLPEVRNIAGDRALLRAIHFYGECKRSILIKKALQAKDFETFLQLILAGGHSSVEYNQNAFSLQKPDLQGVPLALALSQRILEKQGAWRLQGSGFSGTVQAFVPKKLYPKYCKEIDRMFGKGACIKLHIRKDGPIIVA